LLTGNRDLISVPPDTRLRNEWGDTRFTSPLQQVKSRWADSSPTKSYLPSFAEIVGLVALSPTARPSFLTIPPFSSIT